MKGKAQKSEWVRRDEKNEMKLCVASLMNY